MRNLHSPDLTKMYPTHFAVATNLRSRATACVVCVLSLLTLIGLVQGQDIPAYRGYVNDFAGVIDRQDAAHIEGLLTQVRERTAIQIAVVTVPTLGGMSVEDYSLALARRWGIGEKKSNTGLLLLVAPTDRKYRIEVGYGLEGELPDGLVGEIGRRMVPFFRAQRYGPGITRGIDVLVATIAQTRHVDISGSEKSLAFQNRQRGRRSGGAGGILRFGLLVLIFVVVAIAASASGKRRGPGGRYRRRFGSDWIWYPIIFSGGGSGGFGGSSGGGSSLGDSGGGGFGGFGGGGFGGGGSSGSW